MYVVMVRMEIRNEELTNSRMLSTTATRGKQGKGRSSALSYLPEDTLDPAQKSELGLDIEL